MNKKIVKNIPLYVDPSRHPQDRGMHPPVSVKSTASEVPLVISKMDASQFHALSSAHQDLYSPSLSASIKSLPASKKIDKNCCLDPIHIREYNLLINFISALLLSFINFFYYN
jgi:hypothetical protein